MDESFSPQAVMPSAMSGRTAVPDTLLIYDFLLLFEQEYRLIYLSGWNPVKIAYLCCRFYPILTWPFHAWVWMGNHSFETCLRVQKFREILMVPLTLAPQAVMIIRAWAFTDRNPVVLSVLCILLCILLGFQIWAYSQIQTGIKVFQFFVHAGCFNDNSTPQGRYATKRVGFILLFSSVIDLISVLMMIYHYYRTRRNQSHLGRILLRQAVTIFLAVAVINAFAAAPFLSTKTPQWVSNTGLVFVLTVPNVLACRLLVKLRKRIFPSDTQQLRDISQLVREAFTTSGT